MSRTTSQYTVTWADNSSEPLRPTQGEKYLPDGRLIEWELDANGDPMRLVVDGVSVDPSLLSHARTWTITEKVVFVPERAAILVSFSGTSNRGESVTEAARHISLFDLQTSPDPTMELINFRQSVSNEIRQTIADMHPNSRLNFVFDPLATTALHEAMIAEPPKYQHANVIDAMKAKHEKIRKAREAYEKRAIAQAEQIRQLREDRARSVGRVDRFGRPIV